MYFKSLLAMHIFKLHEIKKVEISLSCNLKRKFDSLRSSFAILTVKALGIFDQLT